MMVRLAPVLVRYRRAVIGAWLAFLALAIVVGPNVIDRFETVPEGAPGVESTIVADQLEALGGASPDVVALIDDVRVDDPADAAVLVQVMTDIASQPGVVATDDPVVGGNDRMIATDESAVLLAVMFDPTLSDDAADTLADDVSQTVRRAFPAGQVTVGGEQWLRTETVEQNESDIQRAELLSLPIVLVLAVIIFGGLLAASLPLLVALVAVPGSLLVLFGISELTDLHLFALNAATMLGLGLAIDYALLIVSRFREERAGTADVGEAVIRTVRTAGVTVAFSGLTVTVALLGFLVFDNDVFRSIGLGGIGVVLLSMLTAITLLPAVLATIGDRTRLVRLPS
jgi:RND superfamily putative drug exporter